jgi:hypothetical protein
MDISRILTISGKPGLYKVVGQTNNGVIVESLIDGKRTPTYSNHQVSALEEISIYGKIEDVPLKDIFQKMYDVEAGKATSVSTKEKGGDLRDYFSDLVPEFDGERVYNSDIKKVMSWYNTLLAKGFIEAEPEANEVIEEEVVEEKPKPKKASKKKQAKPAEKKAVKPNAKKKVKKKED